jgi:Fic family protein/DNA-binding XRE family transcriptional regulator
MNYKQQLKAILKATNWSQEQLARELAVSFATLNAWLNDRATPRKNAMAKIDKAYINVIGTDKIAAEELQNIKNKALRLKLAVKTLVENRAALDKLTLYLTYHTNTIEGSTMTLSDVNEVVFEHKVLANKTAIEQTEARNHQAALNWLLDQINLQGPDFVLTEDLILGIHLRLMNGIQSDAGQYRRHSVRIMGARVALANWQTISDKINQYIEGCNSKQDDLIRQLAKSHADFEQIHPFSDGNGRTGRLLMLAQALKSNLTSPLVLKERKYAYYKYLEIAQAKEDYAPLESFIAQSIVVCNDLLG